MNGKPLPHMQPAQPRCCLGVDLEEEAAGDGKGPKVRGMTDSNLAKKLRAELKQMLSQPLRQRMNSKFFTGGTSQIVAQSVAARRGEQERQGIDTDGVVGKQEAVVDATAMRASVAEAQRVVQLRAVPQDRSGSASAKKKRQRTQMTLAEHQTAALKRALAAKQSKKARKTMQSAVYVPRDPGGQMTLTAIRDAATRKA